MKQLPVLLVFIIMCAGCKQRPGTAVEPPGSAADMPLPPPPPPPQPPSPHLKEPRCFPAIPSRHGATGSHILFNSMPSFPLSPGGEGVRFNTECLVCQPVEVFNGHLLFARQLEIYYDSTVYHPLALEPGQPVQRLPLVTGHLNRQHKSFRFSRGKGRLRWLKPACNDSELFELVLFYPAGMAKFERLVNAAFFEYDLDGNGRKEQYIVSLYNCSQELTVLQFR